MTSTDTDKEKIMSYLNPHTHRLDGPDADGALRSDTVGTLLPKVAMLAHRDVLTEVAAERARQDAKWGEQNHGDADAVILSRLNGSGPFAAPESVARRLAEFYEIPTASRAKFLCQSENPPTWAGIAVEELAEVLEATTGDPAQLRAEWIQLAAVAVAAVEAIDRREVSR